MIYGYVRISKDSSDTENQKQEIRNYAKHSFGENAHIEFLEETISGAKTASERGLSDFVKKMKKDNVLLVSSMSRLGRNVYDVCETINTLIKKGVRLITIQENREFGDNIESRMFATFFAIFADIERDFISKRTAAEIARRKADGTYTGGRRFASYKIPNESQLKNLNAALRRGEYRKNKLWSYLGMTEVTFKKFLDRNPDIETVRKQNQIINREKGLIIENVDGLKQITMKI